MNGNLSTFVSKCSYNINSARAQLVACYFILNLCAVSTACSQSCKASCSFIFFMNAGMKFGKLAIIRFTVSRAAK